MPGLAAFCRGAGIDPRAIPADARGPALHLAGQLLRESVLGLMDLNHNRHEFRSRFRITPPPEDGPESPLNFSRGVDEALVRLLTTLSTRAGSVDAIRHNFRELKATERRHDERHARRVRGIPGPRRPEGTRGALRPRRQARRLRHAEQGQVLGTVQQKCSQASPSVPPTASRTCSRKPLPRHSKPSCAPWYRRGAAPSEPTAKIRSDPDDEAVGES